MENGIYGSGSNSISEMESKTHWNEKFAHNRESSAIDSELENFKKAIVELDASVKELINRIAPVCQPANLPPAEMPSADAKQIQAMPSAVRTKVISLRSAVEGISREISRVHYRIEV
jgi:hypothetical protein